MEKIIKTYYEFNPMRYTWDSCIRKKVVGRNNSGTGFVESYFLTLTGWKFLSGNETV
jgi:hypothetical protein